MRLRSYALVGLAASVGYVLGTRAGRERYEQMTRWARQTSDQFGIGPAVDQVVNTTQNAAGDLRQAAGDQAKDLVQAGADAVSNSVDSATQALKPDA